MPLEVLLTGIYVILLKIDTLFLDKTTKATLGQDQMHRDVILTNIL